MALTNESMTFSIATGTNGLTGATASPGAGPLSRLSPMPPQALASSIAMTTDSRASCRITSSRFDGRVGK